jgi:hypothetical protein
MCLAPAAEGIHNELPDVGRDFLVVGRGCLHLRLDALVSLETVSHLSGPQHDEGSTPPFARWRPHLW